MTAAGLLDHLASLIPTRPSVGAAVKAVSGPGFRSSSTYQPISAFTRDPMTLARLAQDVYLGNRHVRKAERVIAQRFATVPWHLEDGTGTRIGTEEGENSEPAYLAVRDLMERPYRPEPRDPRAAVPRTRSTLWNITCRHMGLAGYGFWYLDEAEQLAGTPTALLYINPARMKPAVTDTGALRGWVLDPDSRGGGTPLEVEQVIPFQLEPPDTGHLGAGLVETAMTMVDLTRYGDRHASGVLAGGGRLAGMLTPRGDDTIEEEQYDQLVKDLRNATEHPDSARRVNILRGPVEFTKLSATPSELDLIAVMDMSGDQIAELWGVPGSQTGATTPAGLNSGESKAYDEAVLWQNAVGPRLRSFAETVQFELLDRYRALGLDIQLVIEEPEFDDETPQYDRASKAVTQPLTNRERREMLGLDPFDDPRDDEVWMASTMTRIYPEAPTPPALLPFTGQEVTPPPPAPDTMDDDMEDAAEAMKASLSDVRVRAEAVIRKDLAALLKAYGAAVAERVRDRAEHLARKPSDVSAVFDPARMERDLRRVLEPHLLAVASGTGDGVSERLAGRKAELRDAVIEKLLRSAGIRIKGISETTRLRVAEVVRKGIDEGLSAAELGDRIEATSGLFDELRAETIARTETATVLNEAAVAQYREFGVDRVTVVDGDEDDACADADGQVWTLEQAEASPIAHPNCVRSFTPLVGAPA